MWCVCTSTTQSENFMTLWRSPCIVAEQNSLLPKLSSFRDIYIYIYRYRYTHTHSRRGVFKLCVCVCVCSLHHGIQGGSGTVWYRQNLKLCTEPFIKGLSTEGTYTGTTYASERIASFSVGMKATCPSQVQNGDTGFRVGWTGWNADPFTEFCHRRFFDFFPDRFAFCERYDASGLQKDFCVRDHRHMTLVSDSGTIPSSILR